METDEIVRPSTKLAALAFTGIHVISPEIFDLMTEAGAFAIVDCYLRLAKEGCRIAAFRADDYYWRDVGTEASLRAAERDLLSGRVGQ